MTTVVERDFPILAEYQQTLKNGVIANWRNLGNASCQLRSEELCILALKQSHEAWSYVPMSLRTSEFLMVAARINPKVIKISENALQTDEVIEVVLKANDASVLPYISDLKGFIDRYNAKTK